MLSHTVNLQPVLVWPFPVTGAYEIEFRRTLEGLANRVAESIRPVDQPPDLASVWCRQFFSELEL